MQALKRTFAAVGVLDRWAAGFLAWRGALPLLIAVWGAGWALRFSWPLEKIFYGQAWYYFLPELTVSDADRIMRRALVGTITNALGLDPSILAVKVIYAAGVVAATAALAIMAWIATRSLIPRERLIALALFALSPATILHWADNAGRLDTWVIFFAVIAAFFAHRGWYLAAIAPALAAGLIHEAYFLTFGPLFLAIAYERQRRGVATRAEIARGLVALTVIGIGFLYLFLFGTADVTTLQHAADRIGFMLSVKGDNPYYSYMGFEAHPAAWTACFYRESPTLILVTLHALAYLQVQSVALLGWSGRSRVGLALLPLLGVAALCFVALDSGARYVAMASVAMWLQFFFVLLTEQPSTVFRTWPLAGLCAFTAFGPLGISHGFHSMLWLQRLLEGQTFENLARICNAAI